jgi:predicted kinase
MIQTLQAGIKDTKMQGVCHTMENNVGHTFHCLRSCFRQELWFIFSEGKNIILTMIVIVFGLPGSGKSYFASRLATLIKADYVNSDRLRLEMFEKRTYSDQEKAAVYNNMLEKMKEAISQHRNLVLDATFHKNETRKPFIEAIKGRDDVYFIEVWADEKIIKERLKKPRPYSEADIGVYTFIRQHWEPLNEAHLMLESTDENIDQLLQKAAAYLQLKNDKGTDR